MVLAIGVLPAVGIGLEPPVSGVSEGAVRSPDSEWLTAPDLRNPLRVRLHRGDDSLNLRDGRDCILRMPSRKKTGPLYIKGGRNVVLVGGRISVSRDGVANITVQDGRDARPGRVVHIEGVLIDASGGGKADGIRIRAPKAVVQVKHTRIVGLKGSFSSTHADLIQPWGGVKRLLGDGFTGASHYNGLYLRRENDPLGPRIGPVVIRNANVFGYRNARGTRPSSTLRAIAIGTQPVPPSDTSSPVNCRLTDPVRFRAFYAEPPPGKRPGQFVFPHDGMRAAGCPAKVAAGGGSVDWPALRSKVDGVVRLGPPPGGDFVPRGTAGLGYSP